LASFFGCKRLAMPLERIQNSRGRKKAQKAQNLMNISARFAHFRGYTIS
jgi:hypothetical protein